MSFLHVGNGFCEKCLFWVYFKFLPTLQRKSYLCVPFLGIAWPQSQYPHSCVCERFIYSQDQSTYFPAAEQTDRSWKYINLSQTYKCRDWETEHYTSGNNSFISGNTLMGTRHLYWILTGPSFAVYMYSFLPVTSCHQNFYNLNAWRPR